MFFSDCVPFVKPVTVTACTLFQEIPYQISFDQKFGKLELMQMRHEQNGCEKLQWSFLKSNNGSTQKCRNFQNLISKNYSCEYILCEEKHKVGLFMYHCEGFHIPQFGNHCTGLSLTGCHFHPWILSSDNQGFEKQDPLKVNHQPQKFTHRRATVC